MQTIQVIMGFSRIWEIGAKALSKRGISCFETENYCLLWVPTSEIHLSKTKQLRQQNWSSNENNFGFSNFQERQTDRQIDKLSRILSLRTALWFILHALWNSFLSIINAYIQLSISNKKLGMERNKSPLELVKSHIRGGKFSGDWPYPHSPIYHRDPKCHV